MSRLPAISGKLAREALRHYEFTLVLMNLRIQASGHVTKFDLQEILRCACCDRIYKG
jgi:hypothetical protein